MMANKPPGLDCLNHVALFVKDIAAAEYFYVTLIGMKVDWRPDPDNIYLTLGSDNLALHKAPADKSFEKPQRLDHIGFKIKSRELVDVWCEYLSAQKVEIKAAPKDHRDGTRSFFCADPEGVVVQFIFYPSLSNCGD